MNAPGVPHARAHLQIIFVYETFESIEHSSRTASDESSNLLRAALRIRERETFHPCTTPALTSERTHPSPAGLLSSLGPLRKMAAHGPQTRRTAASSQRASDSRSGAPHT
jgi:hypothetical protein